MDKVINFVLFQAGWFSCVLLGTTDYHFLGPLLVAFIVMYHLKTLPNPLNEMRLLALAFAIGIIWENLLTVSGLLIYPQGQIMSIYAPIWIIAMWPLLTITLNLSLRWLKNRHLLAALFGGIGGPMAFLAGERLGAVQIPNLTLTVSILAIGWAMLFPVMMKLSMQYDGHDLKLQKASGSSL